MMNSEPFDIQHDKGEHYQQVTLLNVMGQPIVVANVPTVMVEQDPEQLRKYLQIAVCSFGLVESDEQEVIDIYNSAIEKSRDDFNKLMGRSDEG